MVANFFAARIARWLHLGLGLVVFVQTAEAGNVFRADRNFATRLEAASGEIRAVAATPDGGFVVAGRFSTIAGQPHLDVAKFKSDGTLDAAFNPNRGFDGEVNTIAVQSDGRIVVGGSFTTFDGFGRAGIARLNADGTLDSGFNPGAGFDNAVQSIAIQADGKIVVVGDFTAFDTAPGRGVVRLNGNGSVDSTFSVGTGLGNSVNNRPVVRVVVVQGDGKILVGGDFDNFAGTTCQDLVRLNPTGALDATFNVRGSPGVGAGANGVYALAIQQNGLIVVGGIFTTFNDVARHGLTRLNPDGTTDATFGTGAGANTSQVLSLALQADGRLVAGGSFTVFNGTASGGIVRLNPNGTVDASFNPGAGFRNGGDNSGVFTLAILTDGRIAAGGIFTTLNNQAMIDVARLTSTGATDTLATGPLWGPAATLAAATGGGGKIVVAGFMAVANGVRRTGIARLNGDGSLDPTFAQSGSGFDANVISRFVVQPDGKIVVIGGFSSYNGVPVGGIARLNTDGTLDATFALAGSGFDSGTFFALALQADGKIVLTGGFTRYNGTSRPGIARLNADGSLDAGFNPGSGFDSSVFTLAVQGDGKIVAGGAFVQFNGARRPGIARLNVDGSLDTQFDPGTGFTFNDILGNSGLVEALAIQPDGKIIAGGDFTTFDGVSRTGIARLNSNGTLDGSFGPGTDFSGFAISLVVQPDGKIIAGELFSTPAGVERQLIVRLNPDGRLDHTFSLSEALGSGARLAGDGRILVTGPGAIANGVVQVGFSVVSSNEVTGPVFTTQPMSATVAAGNSVTFTAAASGDPAPSYQWFKGGVALAGRTGATLNLGNVQPADNGSYTVVATNPTGSATSNAAILAVTSGGGGGGGGYGGGGAVSLWFIAANLAVVAGRRLLPAGKQRPGRTAG